MKIVKKKKKIKEVEEIKKENEEKESDIISIEDALNDLKESAVENIEDSEIIYGIVAGDEDEKK